MSDIEPRSKREGYVVDGGGGVAVVNDDDDDDLMRFGLILACNF